MKETQEITTTATATADETIVLEAEATGPTENEAPEAQAEEALADVAGIPTASGAEWKPTIAAFNAWENRFKDIDVAEVMAKIAADLKRKNSSVNDDGIEESVKAMVKRANRNAQILRSQHKAKKRKEQEQAKAAKGKPSGRRVNVKIQPTPEPEHDEKPKREPKPATISNDADRSGLNLHARMYRIPVVIKEAGKKPVETTLFAIDTIRGIVQIMYGLGSVEIKVSDIERLCAMLPKDTAETRWYY